MSWTVTKEEIETRDSIDKRINPKLNVRATIDLDNEQAELKDLIAALQKHMKEGTVTKVYVIMSNDYPDAVFSDETAATTYCVKRKAERENQSIHSHPIIYWRSYEFKVDQNK